MGSHCGRIDRNTKAGAVYRYLKKRRNRWVGAWEIANWVKTLCLHTYVHEARQQLPKGEALEHRTVRRGDERCEQYRVRTHGKAAA